LAFSRGGAPEMRARATSMASAEVPDIKPRTREDFAVMGMLERRFHHRGPGEHREENCGEGKKTTERYGDPETGTLQDLLF
jgi:hypothetical protein